MPVMFNEERNRFIIQSLDTNGTGLEIAPYFNPAVKKSEHRVFYTDYVSTEELREKASSNPSVKGQNVPEIDFVWRPGQRLAACVPAGLAFDYAIASHVLEHVPNPIGWINQILETLKVGGKLALVVPDKRVSCDYYRQLTDLGDVLANAIEAPSRPTSAQILDFMLYAVPDDQEGGQRPYELGLTFEQAKRRYPDEEAFDMSRACYNAQQYLDVHCTVWTASSFHDVMTRAASLGLLNVEISKPVENEFEFIVFLTRTGDVPVMHRRDFEGELAHLKQAYVSAQELLTSFKAEIMELKRYKVAYAEALAGREKLKRALKDLMEDSPAAL